MLVKANANNVSNKWKRRLRTVPQTGEQNYHKVQPLLGILKQLQLIMQFLKYQNLHFVFLISTQM
jgi:hypothetical protein